MHKRTYRTKVCDSIIHYNRIVFTNENHQTIAAIALYRSQITDTMQCTGCSNKNSTTEMATLIQWPFFRVSWSQNISILYFIRAKDGGGNNWSYKTCKAPVKKVMSCHRSRKYITQGRGQHKYHAIKQWKNTINQHNHKLSSAWALWRWSPRHG